MLSAEDNELVCRTQAHTPMGKAMRHFWTPALLSAELPTAGCDPLHIELLGENFVAFRDQAGTVGLLDEACCHRGASLALGRVEECGIRCIYHGWLFAADGSVLETPNVADPRFKSRFKAKAYPVREAGGIVWTYLGDAANTPAFPDFPALSAPPEQVLTYSSVIGCNYVQVIEGLLDSSHLSVLHSSSLRPSTTAPDIQFVRNTSHMTYDAAPRIEAEETAFGLHYGAIRPLDGVNETNITAFVSPFFILNPNDIMMAVVPLTDEKCAFYRVYWDGKNLYGQEPLRSQQLKFTGTDLESMEQFGLTRATFDMGRRPQRANGWRQDRSAMKAGHFSGLQGFNLEDAVVSVSSGEIRDRRSEHLSTADMAIALLYKALLRSARQVAQGGTPVALGMSVAHLRGRRVSLPPGTDWRTLVPSHVRQDAEIA